MSESKFYVYSKNGCGFCDRLTQFMDKNDIIYEKFHLGSDFTAEQFVSKFGTGSTFPQVTVTFEQIGGMKHTVKYLVEHKYVKWTF